MQSPNICSQNQWICQQQLSFWRKLLISFLSWGANSTMFVKELRAQLHNGALKPHSKTRACRLRNGFFKNSQTTVDWKLLAIDSEWNFLPVVDTCLMQLQTRFESSQNITGLFSCLFPEQLMTIWFSKLLLNRGPSEPCYASGCNINARTELNWMQRLHARVTFIILSIAA